MLFVCENNQFATEVPFAYAAGNPSVAPRGAAYGIAGRRGRRQRRARRFTERPAKRSRARAIRRRADAASNARPIARGAHAEGMGDFTYRTREEVEEWRERCPIKRFAQRR